MTQATTLPDDVMAIARDRSSRGAGPQTLVAALAFAFGVSAVVWVLGSPPDAAPDGTPVHPALASRSVPATPPAGVRAVSSAMSYNALLDAGYSLGPPPAVLAQSAPLAADFAWTAPVQVAALVPSDPQPGETASTETSAQEPLAASAAPEPLAKAAPDTPILPVVPPTSPTFAETVPLPTPRPRDLAQPPAAAPLRAASRRFAQAGRRGAVAAAAPDNRSFFEKLFGAPSMPGPALAYAAPEEGTFDNARRLTAGPPLADDRHTAVYDIAAHTVYMPDGSRLEAHSGLGNLLDDPGSVRERNRGATPPNVYQLSYRETLFHGVQALRLSPVGGGGTFGRDGLLAHTYMLGPNGASNGCVSFRDYNTFLQAYRNGQVTRLSVIARS